MYDSDRGTGRTTRDLERALKRLHEGHNVLFLVDRINTLPYIFALLVGKLGVRPTKARLLAQYLEIDGQKMYFESNTNSDKVRGWRMENVFTDHHFYEGIRWQDWEWFWQLRCSR